MSDQTPFELLREALALLSDAPNFGVRGDPGQTSHKLAAKIDAYLAHCPVHVSNDEIVREVRERWRTDAGVRVDDGAVTMADTEGLWVGAWLRAGAPIAPIDTEAYLSALGALPLLAREVFLLNRRDGLGYDVIGQRLGISLAQVEKEFTGALVGLHGKLFGGAG